MLPSQRIQGGECLPGSAFPRDGFNLLPMRLYYQDFDLAQGQAALSDASKT